ncbi:ABC transporter permease [Methanolobus profundi]|uniref:Lipoprotein-releasing system permease protein n=1 Tax=Methanolobus profundi TaxID=487685 RepID=A0A1I4TUK4_9EURY|nr:ABC transporter permease [Methanolobus profundi]SFM80183.1 lipoprotein-releasing system permease protein [Methanolobus profundi]
MFELKIALRHISARKRLTFFAVFAVALAIAVIVVLMSMMTGFTEELIDSTVENSPHIVVTSSDQDEDYVHFYSYYSEQLASMDGVEAVSPVFVGQAAISHKDNAEGVNLNGIDPVAQDAVMRISDDMVSGDLFALGRSNNGIVIGDKLAEDLEVVMGDHVDVVMPGFGESSFKVIGIFDTGTSSDETVAYVRFDSALDFFDENGVASRINIRVTDPFQADVVADMIEADTGLDAQSWIEANSEILNLLNTQTLIVWIYYGLIYMIAGFGIANTLFTVVMDKKREIGMLMAMGASKKNITMIFLQESLILGTMGVLLGCILGYLASSALSSYQIDLPSEMYFGLTTLPLKADIMNYVYAVIFSFFINIVAGVYPARKAASLDPVGAIESD